MKLTLVGNTPSKKNSKIMVFSKKRIVNCIKEYQRTISNFYDVKPALADILATVEKTKPIVISNKNYYDWHKENLKELKGKYKKVDYKPALVYINLYRKTKHRIDWNNISHSITDILVNLEILEDDSTEYCKPMFGNVFYDKENPRAEVFIKELMIPQPIISENEWKNEYLSQISRKEVIERLGIDYGKNE